MLNILNTIVMCPPLKAMKQSPQRQNNKTNNRSRNQPSESGTVYCRYSGKVPGETQTYEKSKETSNRLLHDQKTCACDNITCTPWKSKLTSKFGLLEYLLLYSFLKAGFKIKSTLSLGKVASTSVLLRKGSFNPFCLCSSLPL